MPKLRVHSFAISIDGCALALTKTSPTHLASAAPRCTNGLSRHVLFDRCLAKRAAQRARTTTSQHVALTRLALGSSVVPRCTID
jgi:hypothetical protein